MMLKTKTWGKPYRTTTIPSGRNTKTSQNGTKLPTANITLSSNRQPQRKQFNDQMMMHQRRENYLNSQFNRRRNTLKQITKENKKIYQRINSQKSLYSQKQMQKSTDSLRSLSRVSSRSRNSNSSNKPSRKNQAKRPKSNVTVQSESIKNIQDSNLNGFRGIFGRSAPRNQENNKLLPNQSANRSVSLRNQSKALKPIEMGSMLHRIAQEMLEPVAKIKGGGRRKLLY